MTENQRQIIQELLRMSYEHGFGTGYSLKPIAQKLGLTEAAIYDKDSESGIMWEYGSFGNGMLSFSEHGHSLYAAVFPDAKDLLENWSGFRL